MLTIIVLLVIGLLPVGSPAPAQVTDRIGVHDSRAIAIAWAGTEPFLADLAELRKQHRDAEEAGDTELAGKLAARGQAMQAELHRQGFSTAPVDNILARFQTEIAAVLARAGVTVLLSRWDEEGLARYPDAKRINLTMDLVKAMKPNERQLDRVRQIGDTPPIPLEELEEHQH